jgi:CheY-like chemotaxis protein
MSKILVIDDSEAVRTSLAMTLRQDNHVAVAVGNGKEALHAVEHTGPYDLVVVDIFMPEMDGIETIEKLRTLSPHIKIIAISAGGMGLQAQEMLGVATDMGAVHALAKPFTDETFLALVHDALQR